MTLPKSTADTVLRRALARHDTTRRAILERVTGSAADVRSLAVELRLHQNAIRQHLAVLRDAGLVVEEIDRSRTGVGRPRVLYRAADGCGTGTSPFEHLAALLVEVAGGRAAGDVGRAAGAALADATPSTDAAMVVAAIAADNGFGVRVDRVDDLALVELHGCPFHALAGSVVCDLHRGVVEGAASAAGGSVHHFELNDPRGGPCVLALDTPGGIR